MPLPFANICEHTFFTSGLNAGSVIIDAGSNNGNFSRGCMDLFGCVPYALEANPESAARIIGPRVFPYALGAKSTEFEFFIGPNSEACSMFRIPEHTTSITVKAVSLKDFLHEQHLKRVDLLKVDIEGAELDVLSGLASMDNIVQASVEFHDFMFPDQAQKVDTVIAHMTALGFDCYNFTSPIREDVLFVNPQLLPLPFGSILRARARVVARHLHRTLGTFGGS
jgi:FkbM family methyltransferase